MNTKPDDETLALWLDDELEGDAFTSVETWADGQPEQLAARQAIRDWRQQISSVIPKEEEPPYPDFFNSRIHAAISDLEKAPCNVINAKASWWRSGWFMPAAAAAGMTLAFWMGTRTTNSSTPASVVEVSSSSPVVYTPETGVRADYFASRNADATVIVLDGVPAISDALDFRETASVTPEREVDSTASKQEKPISEITQ
ncbi:MAG: hypothetical protein CFE26_02675 [Verrucomicrobiales bacterium VVV1]|nr:MAG: hypothetical protein CFE26_02675 [Verrucomicrobiales bacterium VVV1]